MHRGRDQNCPEELRDRALLDTSSSTDIDSSPIRTEGPPELNPFTPIPYSRHAWFIICYSRLTSLSPPPVRRFQHASNERERTNRYPVIDLSTPSLHHPPQETVSPVALCLSVSPNLLKSQDSSSRKDHWYVSSVLSVFDSFSGM